MFLPSNDFNPMDYVHDFIAAYAPSNYPHPIYRLEVNGALVGVKTAERLMSLSVRDCRGFEADQLDIELSDHDGALPMPNKGDLIKVWLGFKHSGLSYMGEFKLSEYSFSGSPDKLKITARAADLAASLAEQKEKSWHKTTIYNIVSTIAAANGYQAKISEIYKTEEIDHIDQTSESDSSFLTRLAEQSDAVATVKNGTLLFMNVGECVTASGEPIPLVLITRKDGDNHTYTQSDTESYEGVRAYYKTAKEGQKGEVIVNKTNVELSDKERAAKELKAKPKKRRRKGEKTQKTPPPPPIDTGGQKIKTLRHLYASYSNALRGARSAFKRLKRGLAEFKISLAIGRPELYSETPAIVQGFKASIDAQDWVIKGINHKLDNNGLTTDLDFEVRLSFDDENDDEEEK